MNEARQEVKPGKPSEALPEAVAWLEAFLADGAKPVVEIREAAKQEVDENGKPKFAWRTIENAKAELGVISEKIGFGKGSYYVWKLPSPIDRNNDTFPHRPQNADLLTNAENIGE